MLGRVLNMSAIQKGGQKRSHLKYGPILGTVIVAGMVALLPIQFKAGTFTHSVATAQEDTDSEPDKPKSFTKEDIIDRAHFFAKFRTNFYRITDKEAYLVDRYERIFDYWDSQPQLKDLRWLAYILATTYHETGRRIQAVRECFGKTDQESINCVTSLYRRGRIKRNYAAIDKVTGKAYFGRGHVQLTWDFNYKRMGKELGMGDQVYINPDLALHPDSSVAIMAEGMIKGIFTGKRLSQYFNATTENWGGARRIVNGLDKYTLIAGYGRKFYASLRTMKNEIPVADADDKKDPDTKDPVQTVDCTKPSIPQSCLSKLTGQLAVLNTRYDDLNKTYQNSLAANNILEDKVKTLTQDLSEAQKDLPAAKAELAGLKKAHQVLQNEYNELEKTNKTNADEKLRLAALSTELQTKLDDAITTGSTGDGSLLKQRLDELEKSQNEVNQQLASIKVKQSELNTLQDSLAKKEASLKDRTADIELSKNALQVRETNLLKELDNLNQQQKQLSQDQQELTLEEERLKRFDEDLKEEKRKFEEENSKSWYSKIWDSASSTWRSK